MNKLLIFIKSLFKLKRYKRQLLDSLETIDETIDRKDPLSKVRKALGSIAYIEGNPLTKTEISLQITTIFVQLGVGVIPPAVLPVQLQTNVPVYVFGLTDFYGGYLRCQSIIPEQGIWFYNGAAIQLAPIGLGQVGDLIIQHNAVVLGVTYSANVIIHCNNVAYGTFLNSFVSDLITLDTIRYIVPAANINQFVNPIIFGYQTLFGKTFTDTVDPRMYITNKDFQPQIADIPINLPIDKSIFTGFQLDVFCQQVSWVLFVKKVEALTNRPK